MNLRMLDKEIAEKVFGYKVRVTRSITQQIFEYEFTNINYPDRKVWLELPHYSSNANNAMDVVEKLGEFQITFSEGKWDVNTFLSGIGFNRTRDKNKKLPELICLAALKRIKAQEEYERNNS